MKIFRKLILLAVALSLAAVQVSCRAPKQDPFAVMAKKYSGGANLELDAYYLQANGIKPGIKGIVIETTQDNAAVVMDMIATDFVFSMPFRIEKNYGKDDRKDKVAIIEMMDQFDLVRALGTRGKEDGVDTPSIVKALKKINSLVKIRITGAGSDFVEFDFAAVPADWTEVAAECADIAPNIVQYGTGTLKVLEEELRQYNKAVLWWF